MYDPLLLNIKKLDHPVLSPGTHGSWDDEVAANPRIFKINDIFYNFYTGYSKQGTFWGIGLAASDNLYTWHRMTKKPLIHTGNAHEWYQANIDGAWLFRRYEGDWCLFHEGRRLFNTFETQSFGFSLCDDDSLFSWKPYDQNPVFTPTGRKDDFDATGLLAPIIYKVRSSYWMFYSGYNGEKMRTGLAFSDDLINWERASGGPVLDTGPDGRWDSHAAILINLFQVGKTFYGFYEGMGANGRIAAGIVHSTDLLHWERFIDGPIITGGGLGSFDESKLCSPYNIIHNGKLYLFFGAHPVGERPGSTGMAMAELAEWAKNAVTCGDEILL